MIHQSRRTTPRLTKPLLASAFATSGKTTKTIEQGKVEFRYLSESTFPNRQGMVQNCATELWSSSRKRKQPNGCLLHQNDAADILAEVMICSGANLNQRGTNI